MTRQFTLAAAALALVALALGGCGGGSGTGSRTAPRTQPSGAASQAALTAAEHPAAGDFPASHGKSLTDLARGASQRAGLGLSTGTFVPGVDRFGFAIIDSRQSLVYAPTALYVARTPTSPASGPYLAPIDPMIVPPAFRSRNAAAGPGSIEAIYAGEVRVPRPGNYYALALAREGGKLVEATSPFIVQRSSPIPAPGQRGPAINTLTPADVHGDLAKISTRIPPDDMNKVNFRDVVGKRPVALLISTPALCQSRVCGPVTDIGMYMEHQFGSKMTFIHQEVYVDNNPKKGLRPQLLAFHLQTEPWLFTFNKRGRIAARLEGAFGINEFRKAIEAALR
jgi:hypothetical protein